LGLAELGEVLKDLQPPADPRLLVGINTADDAGVFQISEDLALIQTVDFFTPILDDPYVFGQVAAANSLSDVYAMGGTPITVLNVVGWPKGTFPLWVLTEVLRGGQDKVVEAGAVVAGGHTCIDRELKYGLSVTGTVHPKKIYTNAAAKAGDRLILTKPLGMGVISTAIKLGRGDAELAAKVGRIMATLNKTPSEVMQEFRVHACTDVTGFGLLGHLWEMLKASGVSARLFYSQVPILEEAFPFAGGETVPGGSKSNRAFVEPHVKMHPVIGEEQAILIFDAQTSGGLILSAQPEDAEPLLAELHRRGVTDARIIGEVLSGEAGKIEVLP
jgi:selenide,water dikinase